MTDEIVTTLLGLGGIEALAVKVSTRAIGELLQHPRTDPNEPVAVLSSVPGRMRLRAAALKRSLAAAARVESGLAALLGVKSVEASPVTGTVLVTYAAGAFLPEDIELTVRRATAAFRVERVDSDYQLPAFAELALSLI